MVNGRFIVALLALAFAVACSSSSGESAPTTQGPDGGPVITCEGGSDVYVANLQKPGRGGALKFILQESSPAPPARGRNTWIVQILDAGGKPISGARIALTATMPAHGHSSPTVPVVTPKGDGYEIGPISLFMPGLWEVTLEVDGGVKDSAVFSFCVAG